MTQIMVPEHNSSTAVPDCITSPESRELFARLETQIQDVLHLLADLRRQQNTLIPAARVPGDTLFHIFSFLAQSEFRDVLRASQVCLQWRAVASAPSLWTRIPLRSVKQTQELLSRSGIAPIHLSRQDNSPVTFSEVEALLSPHIHRIQSCDIVGHSKAPAIREWMSLLAAPAPNLEELTLSLDDAIRYRIAQGFPIDWPCWKEQSDFGGHLSALHTLTLHGVYFPPGSPIFRHLRALTLSAQPTSLLTSTAVGHTVSHIPQLEKLCIESLSNARTEYAIANTSFSAALPRLRRLTIRSVPQCFPGNLLDTLVLPATAKIDLDGVGGDGGVDVRMPRFSGHFAPPCIGTRSFECTVGDRRIAFRTRRDPESMDPDLVLAVDCGDTYRRVLAVLTARVLVDGAGLERYTLKYAQRANTPKSLGWQGLLAKMDALRVLTVIGGPEEHLVELLDTLGLDEHRCRCASLKEIHIQGAEWTKPMWCKLRAVARTRQPTLRTIRISDSGSNTDASDDIVREVVRLVETFEREAVGKDARGDDESGYESDTYHYGPVWTF